MIVNCKNCGITFKKSDYDCKRYPHHFCCIDCFYTWRRTHLKEYKQIAKSLNKKNIRRIKTRELTFIMGIAGPFKPLLNEWSRRLNYAATKTAKSY